MFNEHIDGYRFVWLLCIIIIDFEFNPKNRNPKNIDCFKKKSKFTKDLSYPTFSALKGS